MMKRFYEARNKALKEGEDPVKEIFYVNEIATNDDGDLLIPDSTSVIEKPPGADYLTLINDTLYWRYELSDGVEALEPIHAPEEVMLRDGIFKNQPETHLGEDVSGVSVRVQSRKYLDYLWSMMDHAEEHFLDPD